MLSLYDHAICVSVCVCVCVRVGEKLKKRRAKHTSHIIQNSSNTTNFVIWQTFLRTLSVYANVANRKVYTKISYSFGTEHTLTYGAYNVHGFYRGTDCARDTHLN